MIMKSPKTDLEVSITQTTSLLNQSEVTEEKNVLRGPIAPPKGLEERSSLFNNLLMILVASGGYYFGFFAGAFNSLGTELLKNVYGITEKSEITSVNSRITMFFTIGNLFGVLIVTYLTDRIGRRKLLILSEMICFVLFFGYLVENLWCLLAVRFFGGLVGGINCAMVPIYITEVIPRTKSGVGNILSCVVGVSFTFLALAMEMVFGIDRLLKNWRLVFCWPLPISLVRIVLMLIFIRTETPIHYLKSTKGDALLARKKILNALRKIYTPESAEKAFRVMVESDSRQSTQFRLLNMQEGGGEPGLLSKKYRLRMLTGVVLQIGQQFSGINFLIFFSRDFFEKVSQNGGTMAFVIGAANIFGALLGLKFINYFGRKANMQFGVLVQGLSFLAIYYSIHFQHFIYIIPPIAVSLYMASFAQGMGATMVSFLTEILPPQGVGYSFIVQFIASSIIAGYSQKVEELVGSHNVILGFGLICFVLFFFIDLLVLETKGKDDLQITRRYAHYSYKPLNFK